MSAVYLSALLWFVYLWLIMTSWVGELQMLFQDVVFLPSMACFYATFLGTTACLKTVVGGNVLEPLRVLRL